MSAIDIHQQEESLAARAVRMEEAARTMAAAGDEKNAAKLQQLAAKMRRGEMNIAFCGHFSAGKSTMINTLLGVNLLPSNPIPTSANVVKIHGGEKAARVYTRNGSVLTFDPDTQMDELKKCAVDGDAVEWVEIAYPGTFLTEETSLLDTPGIDSTDAAHKIATESALHLADAVIYMMDYNHVQAEENFHFTKMLKDRGKPVYLVINMIDKHIEFELDFDSYKESVEEAFATWHIKPDGIFYTSLAEPDHPENQYEAFRDQLMQVMAQRETMIRESAAHAAHTLIEEHVRHLSRQHADERQALEEKRESLGEAVGCSDRDQVLAALQETKAQLEAAAAQTRTAQAHMEKELNRLLENARLTYYTTNEAAERYLESRKPGFKVGLLFTARKTEEERAQRLAALLADFREKVSANLDFHFKELMARLPQEYGIRDEAYHADVHACEIPVTGEFLAAQVKEGAGTREYVLNYCQDISNGIKAEYRRAGLAFIERVCGQLQQRAEAEQTGLTERQNRLLALAAVYEELERLDKREQEAANRLQAILGEGV
jgi:small GTP-binding protein